MRKSIFKIKEKMSNSLVTICIATYNRSSLIPRAIKSVQSQAYRNIEIIVIDDGSIDNTKEVVTGFMDEDSRIRYFKHSKNKGLASARNTAIEKARGTFFTFIDDDDVWEETFIGDLIDLALDYNENWCFCCGHKSGNNCSIPYFEGSLKKYILEGYTPPVAAQFYYTKTLKEIGGYTSRIKSGVDHDLWLKLAVNGYSIKSLEKCLAIPNQNTNEERMTTNPEKRIKGIQKSLEIWEKLIVNNFGKDFFLHFKKNYYFHIYRKFLISALQNKNVKSSLIYFIRCPMKNRLLSCLLKGFFKNRFSKDDNKKINVISPSFSSFIDKN